MKFTSLLLSCVLAVTALSSAHAQQVSDATSVPQLINFAGTLPPTAVGSHSEAVSATFLIYGEQQGGEALWMETQTVHPDALGHYTITLGAATSQGVPANLFAAGEPRWLGIQIPGESEAARVRLVSVPYAMKSGDAETLGGLPLSAFVLAKDNKTAASESASEASAALQVKPAATAPSAGTVTSVSLSAPTSDFTVSGNPVTKSGTLAFKWTTPPTSADVANAIVKRDSAGGIGVTNVTALGSLYTEGDASVSGMFLQGNAAKGVRIRNNGAAVDLESLGAALYVNWVSGQNTYFNNRVGIGTVFPQAELNLNYGGAAIADTFLIGNNSSKGLQLRDTGTGVDIESIGVPLYMNYVTKQPAYINPNGGSVFIGQYSTAGNDQGYFPNSSMYVGAGESIETFGNGDVDTNYTSAVFTNDVYVLGNFHAYGTKDFSIDHPLDPLNKTLDHAAIESSEVLNQYSGNITLNANGEATITFPDWFSAMNTDFRYQLTAVGAPGPGLYIAKEVEGNSFTIAGGKPGSKVSWQVTAKRNDAYMQAHPFQAERQKPEAQRGHHTLPELYAPRKDSASAKDAANAK